MKSLFAISVSDSSVKLILTSRNSRLLTSDSGGRQWNYLIWRWCRVKLRSVSRTVIIVVTSSAVQDSRVSSVRVRTRYGLVDVAIG